MKKRILIVIWFICMALAALYTGEYLYVCILAVSGVVLVMSGVYCQLSGRHIKGQHFSGKTGVGKSVPVAGFLRER